MKKMKNTIAIVLVFITLSCSKSNAQKTAFSKVALAESVLNTDGSPITFKKILSQNKGKNVVIKIWASWCRDCIKDIPKAKEIQAAHPDATYIYISMDDTAEKWKYGIEKYDLKGIHYMAKDQMKGIFAKAIDLDWIPRTIIIDKKGKIVVYRAIETDFEKINNTLSQLENENN